MLTLLGSMGYSANYNFLGSDRVSLILDMQMQKINQLDSDGRSAFGSPISDSSWGYIAVVTLDYQDAFANIKILPSIVWVHDVKGHEPGAAGGFQKMNRPLALA